MSLIFNNTNITKIIYNNVTLDKVIYNGVVVYESGTPTMLKQMNLSGVTNVTISKK